MNAVEYCQTLTDTLDNYENKTGYYLAIILPSVFGGLLLICCCLTCCGAYCGIQGYTYYRDQQLRQSKKGRRRATQ